MSNAKLSITEAKNMCRIGEKFPEFKVMRPADKHDMIKRNAELMFTQGHVTPCVRDKLIEMANRVIFK